jgi:hypothetical protein
VETKEKMVFKGQEDYLDQPEMLEREGQEVSWAKLDHKVQLENLVLLEEEECQVQMVHRVQRDQLVTGVWQDPLDQKANLEILEDLVHLDCKV